VPTTATGPPPPAPPPGAVTTPLPRRAAATSRPKRARNSGFAASSARMAFAATGRPPGETPRNTRPMPPWPSCPTSRYGPIVCGSSGCSSLVKLNPHQISRGRSVLPTGADRTTINTVVRKRTCREALFGVSDPVLSSLGCGRTGRDAGRRLENGQDGVHQVHGEVVDGQDRPGRRVALHQAGLVAAGPDDETGHR